MAVKLKTVKQAELFAIHFEGKPLHFIKGKRYDWTPPKKIYYTMGAAKAGLKYVPSLIRENCTIVRYIPETN